MKTELENELIRQLESLRDEVAQLRERVAVLESKSIPFVTPSYQPYEVSPTPWPFTVTCKS